jgi:hypothetical protein
MKELRTTVYDSRQYSDENMLLNFKLLEPVDLQKNLTYLWGRDSDRFPLLTMTEGNGAIKSVTPIKLNDTQYTWDVMGRMKFTSQVVGLSDSSLTKPGFRYGSFKVIMKDNWFPKDYGVSSPDGTWYGRIQGEPKKLGETRYEYTISTMSADPESFCDLANFAEGKYWSMTAPTIAASKSDGNRFNAMAPGKMTNQFGYHRFSKNIAGNIASKVTSIQFELMNENGTSAGTTNKWFPFEWKQFEVARRILQEEDLYYSEYNRDEKGVIHLVDERTGEPIPRGAGVRQIVKSVGNYDTYANLTLQKIESVVNSIFDNRVDHEVNEIIIYTGKGGARMWHQALLAESKANQFFTPLGEQVIQGGEYLTYGKYFNQYKTYEGKLITVKPSYILDHGIEAEKQLKNGDTHLGLPKSSYTMMFIDHSRAEEGNRNVELVCEAGRESVVGVYKGMATIPDSWGAYNNMISTKDDIASYENITSQGINITNPTTSFWLDMEL